LQDRRFVIHDKNPELETHVLSSSSEYLIGQDVMLRVLSLVVPLAEFLPLPNIPHYGYRLLRS
jgi:hypothetical protein